MKRLAGIWVLVMIWAVVGVQPAMAGGHRFSYKLNPGQQWIATSVDRSESHFMDKPKVSQHQRRFGYTIKKGAKAGWVKIEGRIMKSAKDQAATMLADARFFADMHRSGELRRQRVEVPPPPPLPNQSELPPQLVAMQAQSNQYMADMFKQAVFWFPEFPEEALAPGDEFEMVRKTNSSMGQGAMAIQAATKEIFILEEVVDGLAYFSVKAKSMSKMTGPAGAPADTATMGKGEAIFDMKLGMWVEMTIKTKANVQLGSGSGPMSSLNISKITMELE